jgi:anti-sigma factor RsiW
MNDCTRTREALPALLYGDLPAHEEPALLQHLALCPACRAEQAALRRAREALDILPAPTVQVDLPALYREAERRQETRLRRWRRLATAAVAVAAALLAVFVLRLQVHLGPSQITVSWGAPRPAAQPPAPPAPAPEPVSVAEVQFLEDLVHALAADVADRDRRQQQALLWLQGRLDVLQGQTQQRWTATQRDVSGLYALITSQTGFREKGE